jgi:hypothetical protein
MGYWVPPWLNFFPVFYGFFDYFAECFSIHDKAYADCPTKTLNKEPFANKFSYRVTFVECNTHQMFVKCISGFAECLAQFHIRVT